MGLPAWRTRARLWCDLSHVGLVFSLWSIKSWGRNEKADSSAKRKEGGDYLMWANGEELQETISDHAQTNLGSWSACHATSGSAAVL